MKKLVSNITMIALTLRDAHPTLSSHRRERTRIRHRARLPKSPAPVAANAPALAYPLAKIRNRTIFPATGIVRYVSSPLQRRSLQRARWRTTARWFDQGRLLAGPQERRLPH